MWKSLQLHITHLVRPSVLPVERVLYSAAALFWSTVLSVVPLAQCVVCLSSICLSVTFSIVAKRHVLAKNCLKEQIGNWGQKVDFLGSLPYFYFRFRLYGHQDGRFCLIFARTTQWSVLDMVQMDFLAANHVRSILPTRRTHGPKWPKTGLKCPEPWLHIHKPWHPFHGNVNVA